MRERETPKQRLAYRAYATAEWLARTLPEPVARRVFRWFGRLAHRRLHGLRATVEDNMAHVLGRAADAPIVRAAAREAFDLYARYWLDTFRLCAMPDDEFLRRFEIEGLERIDAALAAGKGCIAVLPHMGNWDAAGRFLGLKGYPVVSVAEELRPRRLNELFLRHRDRLGVRIVPLLAGTHVGQQLAKYLSDNWIVGLVADRDLTGRGVDVQMFGGTRKLPAGPALLSLTSGAPLMGCPVYTTGDGWRCRVGDPLPMERTGDTRADVSTLTARMAAEFERAIAARPVDWHMFQPGWP